jgi:hypothetical protein
MPNFFLQSPRLSYAQHVLPLFRTIFVGGVLVMLALLAGFGAPRPATSSARLTPPARGPLINAAEHPEWKQFLIQAAYQRSDAIERLKELPDAPTIVPAPVVEAPPAAAERQPSVTEQLPRPQQVAALSAGLDDTLPADPTGSVEASPTDLPIDIGEASATELPITIQDLPIPIERPQSLKRLDETQRVIKPAKRRHARAQRPAATQTQPAQQQDFFGALFGGNSQVSSSPSH